MRTLPARLALLAAAGAAAIAVTSTPGTRAADEDADGGSARSDLHTIAGTVSAVAWDKGQLTIQGADGAVTLGVDRNTTVYLESRLGSMRDVTVGMPVRASYGPKQRAFWIE